MTTNLYGRKMFIADLIITTVWAIFMFRYSLYGGYGVFLYIPMRMALCFEMQRKSPWTLYSAFTFLLCMGSHLLTHSQSLYPAKRIVYHLLCVLGYQNDVIEVLDESEINQDVAWLVILNGIIYLWLFAVPLTVGFLQRNISKIEWKRKGVLIYIGVVLFLTIWFIGGEFWIGEFLQGFLLSLLPIVYWALYERNGTSLIDKVSSYRAFNCYLGFLVLILVCFLIGCEDYENLKIVGLVIAPIAYYVLICRSFRFSPMLTRHAVAMSVAGLLYIFIFYMPDFVKYMTLSLSAILVLYVAIDMGWKHRVLFASGSLFIGTLLFVCPVILGLNPYMAFDVESVGRYHWDYSAEKGMFTTYKDGKVGLRDRFGEILKPEYERIQRLDRRGRYISVLTGPGTLIAKQRHGIYDLAARKFILHPDSIAVSELIEIDKHTYAMNDAERKRFATLRMPGYYDYHYVREIEIEPYYDSEMLPLPIEEDDSVTDTSKNDWEGDVDHEREGSYRLLEEAKKKTDGKFGMLIEKSHPYYTVYSSWYKLLEAMSRYLVNTTYGEPWYSMQPIQFNGDIRKWYEDLLLILDIDYDIISNGQEYTSLIKDKPDSFDVSGFFYRYDTKDKGGYNGMNREIEPAFDEWKFARAKYAEQLSPHQRLSFEQHTEDVAAYIFNEIKGLTKSRNDNANYLNKHPEEE